jgi:serine/threonine protein phosphatase 1
MKNLFVIGDVHGCFHTFQKLLTHWDMEKEIMIQVGDLIDRGPMSAQTVVLSMQLDQQFPGKANFLRGNHEQMMLNYYARKDNNWLMNGGKETIKQFKTRNSDIEAFLKWMGKLPLKYETENFIISHAGICSHPAKFDPDHPQGLLWTRSPLENLGKTQIVGHTPLATGQPEFDPDSRTWYIDTGAYKGICMTGMKFDPEGKLLEKIQIPTYQNDLNDLIL